MVLGEERDGKGKLTLCSCCKQEGLPIVEETHGYRYCQVCSESGASEIHARPGEHLRIEDSTTLPILKCICSTTNMLLSELKNSYEEEEE